MICVSLVYVANLGVAGTCDYYTNNIKPKNVIAFASLAFNLLK